MKTLRVLIHCLLLVAFVAGPVLQAGSAAVHGMAHDSQCPHCDDLTSPAPGHDCSIDQCLAAAFACHVVPIGALPSREAAPLATGIVFVQLSTLAGEPLRTRVDFSIFRPPIA